MMSYVAYESAALLQVRLYASDHVAFAYEWGFSGRFVFVASGISEFLRKPRTAKRTCKIWMKYNVDLVPYVIRNGGSYSG